MKLGAHGLTEEQEKRSRQCRLDSMAEFSTRVAHDPAESQMTIASQSVREVSFAKCNEVLDLPA
jgi:hypothetical protein